jgi:hypothetical protein
LSDGHDDFRRRAPPEFEALKKRSDVGLPRADVIRARRPSFRSDGLADQKRDGLGFRYCDKL